MFEKIAAVTPGAFYRYVSPVSGKHFFRNLGTSIEPMLGISRSDLLEDADLLFDNIDAQDKSRVAALIQKSSDELSDFHAVFKVLTPCGDFTWLEARSKPERKNNGDTVWTGFVYNVTDREQANESLTGYLQNVDHIMDNMLDAIISTDANGTIIFINEATKKLLGFRGSELIGRNIKFIMPAHHQSRHDQYMQDYRLTRQPKIIGSTRSVEVISKRKTRIPVELRICEYYKGSEQRFLGILRDLRDSIATHSEIETLRNTDSLTGLSNRSALLASINETLNQLQPGLSATWLVCLDIDDFRLINEGFGAEYGDSLLVEIGKRLRKFCSSALCIARVHEDEFAVILEGFSDETEILMFVYQLKSHLEAPFQTSNTASSIRLSAGISKLLPSEMNASDTLHVSEVALSNTKHSNRGDISIYEPALNESFRSVAIIDQKLKSPHLLKELFLVFQPQLDADGTLLGYEALLRWLCDGELVRPDVFIPIAERNGTIITIGEWLINQACEFLKAQTKTPAISARRLSINISPLQFQQPDFVMLIKKALETSDIDAAMLHLELTERLLIESTEHVIGKMSELSELGITFSLDDFGTGYSSLAYLSQLPLSELKIDKSFVKGLTKRSRNYRIVEAIITLSKSLGLNVIAEGVENKSEVDALITLGCKNFQGYYFGKPVTPEHLSDPVHASDHTRAASSDERN